MFRSSVLALSLLLISSPALGQATPTESQTLQAVLAEIRQLRRDLQTSAIAARRAQILIYRLHVQEVAVAHASQRLDEAKSSIEQLQASRKYQEIQFKRCQDMKDRAESAVQRQQFEDAITERRCPRNKKCKSEKWSSNGSRESNRQNWISYRRNWIDLTKQ
jgi:hypothetical protein